MAHSYSGILCSDKNKQTSTHTHKKKKKDGWNSGHLIEQKKPDTKKYKYIMYDSIYTKYKNWQKLIYDVRSQVSDYV